MIAVDTPPQAPAKEQPARVPCRHCALPCPEPPVRDGDNHFCCAGCRAVYSILTENGLGRFYDLNDAPGVRPSDAIRDGAFDYLDDEDLRRKLLDFTDSKTSRVTLHIPAIHCIACVWLLENLFQLLPGVGRSQVDFPRKTVAISFDTSLPLSKLVGFLASLGYEPVLKLRNAVEKPRDPVTRRLYLQLGIAGFAFGNVMMLSFPGYLGMDPAIEASFTGAFGWISLVLALPVFLFSASDYWRAAWTCIRQRILTIEFPIAIGIAALFAQSATEVVRGMGPGYLDSFTGLLFFLLCGRWFQRKTWETLSFDRDYTSYFPISVVRREHVGERAIPLTRLNVGDHIVVRNQELVPADAILRSGPALIDYSFVTGESDPVARVTGDYIYAGGRQVGGAIELETVKEVSHSYLTSLWNSDAFHKTDRRDLATLTNAAGRYFTFGVLLIALATIAYWLHRDPSVAIRAFSAVLLVACPCALALSAPFALGSAVRILGRNGFFFRNGAVLERMARVDTIVFDKTGTLTLPSNNRMEFLGAALDPDEQRLIRAVARQSVHPHSRHIADALSAEPVPAITDFHEVAGRGVAGTVGRRTVRLGSATWCGAEDAAPATAAHVHVAIDGLPRGRFVVHQSYRDSAHGLLRGLGRRFRLAVLSGDNDRERQTLQSTLGEDADLRFEQSPHDKLAYVRERQADGRRIMMIGDGLNDAGALKQSDVGVAVSDDVASFSPACDVIMDSAHFGRLGDVLAFSRSARGIVLASFAISILYNSIGISFAASGALSPMIAAILMPASSFSVIGFTLVATRVAARWRNL